MARKIRPDFVNLSQQLETEVNGPDGANRLFTFIGRFDTLLAAFAGESEKETYTLLLGPEFDRKEFHRAIATVSLADFGSQPGAGTTPVRWSINEVDADRDDETGQVELRCEIEVYGGPGGANVTAIMFHVTVLAEMA